VHRLSSHSVGIVEFVLKFSDRRGVPRDAQSMFKAVGDLDQKVHLGVVGKARDD
jgi:hypothetical protein